MSILVLGAGNLLLSDEGFGVHFIRYFERHFSCPDTVKLLDIGTLGMLAAHEMEGAECIYIVDIVAARGEAGRLLRYTKEDLMLKKIPLKLSPHQIGIQEMLLVSEMRGCCPREVVLFGVVPGFVGTGSELSPRLQACLPEVAWQLASELRERDLAVESRRGRPRFTDVRFSPIYV